MNSATHCLRRRNAGSFAGRGLVLAGIAAGTLLAPVPGSGLETSGRDAADLHWIEPAAPLDQGFRTVPSGRFAVGVEDLEGNGVQELWSRPLAGGAPRLLSGALVPGDRIEAFQISPDGRSVAFATSSSSGAWRLEQVPIEGGPSIRVDDPRRSIAAMEPFAFRADSGALGFLSGLERTPAIEVVDSIFANGFESGDSALWSDTTPNACPTPTGGPTLHVGSVPTATWTANGSPHILTNNTLIPAGVTVTVAPCAEVRVHALSDLTVQGTLSARGTPFQRITFKRDDPTQAWDSIWVKSPGFADLAFVDVSGGGAAGSSVLAEGNDLLPPAAPLLADHLKVVGSTSYGVRLFRRAAFHASSRDLVVAGAGAVDATAPFPVRMSLNTVATLPVGVYLGNASDQIQVVGEGNSTIEIDDAFHDRGVPYQVGGPAGALGVMVVDGDPALATLTVDPGVEIRFYTQGSNKGGLFIGAIGSVVASGRIVAAGTAARPILFTGAGGSPVAGSWEGVTFFGELAAGNQLDHVRIDAAGYNGGDAGYGCPPATFPETSGALKIFDQPAASFLTNSTISKSSTHGIYRAWTGDPVDFLAGNSFDQVAFCNEVLPKPQLPAVCPSTPPCPK